MQSAFEIDLKEIRKKARENMMEGAVTESYGADRKQVIEVLNHSLATEIVCVLRYKNNRFAALNAGQHTVAAEFAEHAREEQEHADRLAERINELHGNPNMNPEGILTRAHSEYRESENILELLQENLVAERVAVTTYHEIIKWLGDGDPTTRRLFEEILEQEEQHADDLVDLIQRVKRGEA